MDKIEALILWHHLDGHDVVVDASVTTFSGYPAELQNVVFGKSIAGLRAIPQQIIILPQHIPN
jgi:hypothetical protein